MKTKKRNDTLIPKNSTVWSRALSGSKRSWIFDVFASAKALREGRIDAFFWTGGLPTFAVSELAANAKIRLIDHAGIVGELNKKFGGIYSAGIIPAETYPGQDKDIAIAVAQNLLVADAGLPDRVAYNVVKTFLERRDELIAVHGEAKAIALDNQSPKNSPIPWHPGAVKYLKEKGVAM